MTVSQSPPIAWIHVDQASLAVTPWWCLSSETWLSRTNDFDEQVDGVAVSIIGLADLKTNKKASARFKDLDDLEHLS